MRKSKNVFYIYDNYSKLCYEGYTVIVI